ncbi:nitroreductase family protein [Holdemania massiliensis]|uniref:nitroreductase family protein n=1 Tax=Holdemania massiliensis TaxID=1468449 RepID=UPI00031F0ED7|nr:nitroreductase family protein [Holdemania massiliensis]
MEKHQVLVDKSRCIGCGFCVRDCPVNHLQLRQQKAQTVSDHCIQCGHCVAVCPKQAVSLSGYACAPVEKPKLDRLDPQALLDTLRFRRTIRQFQKREVAPEIMDQIIEAGWLTHTAKNKRDVSFVVLDQQKDRIEQMAVKLFRRIQPAAGLVNSLVREHPIDDHFFFFEAPAVIVILAEDKTNGLLAAQNMEYVAEACGLGVLYSGYFTMAAQASGQIRKALKLQRGQKIAMTLVLGYPAVHYQRSVPRDEPEVTRL